MNTHPHSDHTGGLPALVAEGATIITQKNNEAFFEKALNTPRTLLNDTLAKNPKKAKIEAVAEKKVYSDGTRTVEMYHISPAPHSNGLMIAYIPKEKVSSRATSRCLRRVNRATITSRPWCRFSRSSIWTSIAISTCTPPPPRRPRRSCGRPSGSRQLILALTTAAIAGRRCDVLRSMTKYGTSPWIDRFPKSRVPSYPRQRGPLETDVAIVGGGLTGCATAYAMAAADVKVVLIESERIGRGAAGSGAGWIADDPGVSFADLQKALGLRPARRAWQAWHRAGLDFAALLRRLKISLEPHGSVDVATTAEQTLRLKREQKARRDAGLDAPLLNARVVGAEAGLAARRHPRARRRHDRSVSGRPRSGARRVRARRAGVRTLAGGADQVRPPDGRHPDGRRDDPRQPRRRGDRLADAALQGASTSLLVSPPLRGAHGAGAGQHPAAARPARSGGARPRRSRPTSCGGWEASACS